MGTGRRGRSPRTTELPTNLNIKKLLYQSSLSDSIYNADAISLNFVDQELPEGACLPDYKNIGGALHMSIIYLFIISHLLSATSKLTYNILYVPKDG